MQIYNFSKVELCHKKEPQLIFQGQSTHVQSNWK